MVKCPRCNGGGRVEPYPHIRKYDKEGKPLTRGFIDVCPTCDGLGEIQERSKLKWDIAMAEKAGNKAAVDKAYAALEAFDRKRVKPKPSTPAAPAAGGE